MSRSAALRTPSIAGMEPLVPLLLACQGTFAVIASPTVAPTRDRAVVLVLLALVATVGVLGLLGWRTPSAVLIRGLLVTVTATVGTALLPALASSLLQWFYVAAAVYLLLLLRGPGWWLSAAMVASLAVLWPLDATPPPSDGLLWVGRLVLFALLCLMVGTAAEALRRERARSEVRRQLAEDATHALSRAATHDALTGLVGRSVFTERTREALGQARRHHSAAVVLVVDVDRLTLVNDSMGRAAGDQVLVEVAERFGAVMRPGEVLARLGGDEFGVVAQDVSPGGEVELASRLHGALAEPLDIQGRSVALSCSSGIAVSGPGLRLAEELVQAADVALHAAKEGGRGRWHIVDERLARQAGGQLALEQTLRRAVRQGELDVMFQPLTRASDGRLMAAEALARWVRRDGTSVAPLHFVSLVDDLGLTAEFTGQVVRQSLEALKSWREHGLAVDHIAINTSPAQLDRGGVVDSVRRELSRLSMVPSDLVVEVTEQAMLTGAGAVAELRTLRDLGVGVSLDDFGTGYSSLAYLRRLPLTELKVDREIVIGATEDPTLARTVCDLAHTFGLRCVAEGVETSQQWDAVRAVGVDLVQGFHVAPAMSSDDLTRWALSGAVIGDVAST